MLHLVISHKLSPYTIKNIPHLLGPVWNEGMENIGMEKNAGKEGECSGKTKEKKNTGKK